jgi:hypothetical protein
MRELKKELWPYKIVIETESKQDIALIAIETWLGEHFDAFKGRWNMIYRVNTTDFYFRNGHDATLFSLRWA